MIEIYSDGASKGNPGPAGWGGVIIYDRSKMIKLGGYEKNATNNQMELTAAIKMLEYLLKTKTCEKNITLYSDSEYLIKGITEWIFGWEKNNWKNSTKKPVKNYELWKKLKQLSEKLKPKWIWVKGHAQISGNEMADSIANQAITTKGFINEIENLKPS